MSYSKFTNDVLLDLAEMHQDTVDNPFTSPGRQALAHSQLDAIEAELQSRAPEGQFRDVFNEDGEWIGFEPASNEVEEEVNYWEYYGFTMGDFL